MANKNFEYVKCKRQKEIDFLKTLTSQSNGFVSINHSMDANMSGQDRETQHNKLMRYL